MSDPNDVTNPNDPSAAAEQSFGQVLNAEALMYLTITKDNADADGTDTNIAHVTFDNVEQGTTNVRVDYKILSGNAVFQENGQQAITKFTNVTLSSTVKLIDSTAETGMIEARPFFSPDLAPPPESYTFKQSLQNLTLTLSVNTDNQLADGLAADRVIALVTNSKGDPVKGVPLAFMLPKNANAYFSGTGLSFSGVTGDDGKLAVSIFDNANSTVAVTVACMITGTSVMQSITIHFQVKPAIADFRLQGLVTNGVANDGTPGQVRAIITPTAGSAPENYLVYFSTYGTGTIPPQLCTISAPGVQSGIGQNTTYTVPVVVSGQTTTDAWIHDLDTKAAFTMVQAELKTMKGEHVAYSVGSTNVQINFAASGPQPCPPPPCPPPPPPGPTPPPEPRPTPSWPIEVYVRQAEGIYGPTYPISYTYYRCEFYIDPRSVSDKMFQISINSPSQTFKLGDAAGGFGDTLSAYPHQSVLLGILNSVTSDLGTSISIRCQSRGLVWRGVIYPRSLRKVVTA